MFEKRPDQEKTAWTIDFDQSQSRTHMEFSLHLTLSVQLV